MSTSLSIGEVAQKAGLRTSALRYYETAGVIPPPERVNGRRRYDADVLQRLAIVQLAQQAGFTLAEVRTLFEGMEPGATPSLRWRDVAERKLPQIDDQIRRAEAMRDLLREGLRCDCLTLEDCDLVLARLEPNDS
jgi:MerR family redox-sensitive transcriptional activator SoxR